MTICAITWGECPKNPGYTHVCKLDVEAHGVHVCECGSWENDDVKEPLPPCSCDRVDTTISFNRDGDRGWWECRVCGRRFLGEMEAK